MKNTLVRAGFIDVEIYKDYSWGLELPEQNYGFELVMKAKKKKVKRKKYNKPHKKTQPTKKEPHTKPQPAKQKNPQTNKNNKPQVCFESQQVWTTELSVEPSAKP